MFIFISYKSLSIGDYVNLLNEQIDKERKKKVIRCRDKR